VLAWRGPDPLSARGSKRERARQFYLTALDRATHLDEAGTAQALRDARTADSGYLPALAFLPSHLGPGEQIYTPSSELAALDSFAGSLSDRVLGACVHGLVAVNLGRWHPIVLPPHPSEAARLCLGYYRLLRSGVRGGKERSETARRLWRRFPECSGFADQLVAELGMPSEELVSLTEEMAQPGRPAQMRLSGYLGGIQNLHALGRHANAMRREREAEAEMRRQPESIRLGYIMGLGGVHRALLGAEGTDSALSEHARDVLGSSERDAPALMAHLDLRAAMGLRFGHATRLLDDGNLEASRREWDGLVRLADSLALPELLAEALVRRGRTLVKLGRAAEAERDLIAGREAAQRANHLGWTYEAEHNLLHLYEAMGRDQEARRAGEAFLALTRVGANMETHLMANRDLAWYYQHRGERERARPYFETMLAYADSIGDSELQWAGEYFELTGDLERAEAYFGRVGPGRNTYRAYAGLARLAEATGEMDRALGYARAHDAGLERADYPEVAPLLPGLLARTGRVREAEGELQRARGVARLHGQVAGWATLSAELAALLLRMGEWPVAVAVADSAAEAARRVALAEVRLRAEAISGLARVRIGGAARAAGFARIRGAVREAERIRLPELLAELFERRAEAEAVAGRQTQVLALLARAADLTDSMATSLSNDPKRAGFRSAQMHISNLALETILERRGTPDAAELFAEWSVRRKSRGVLERSPGHAVPAGAVLRTVRSRLGPRDAVIDYAVVDTTVAALVVTNAGAVLRPLPVTAESLRARVGRLVAGLAPRMGNVVDTLHARFDTRLAERLYADLLAPLEADLGARDRLTIVADGPLHQLPFDALVIPEEGSSDAATRGTRFALDRFTISFAPSLAVAGGGDAALPDGEVVAVAASSSDESLAGATREIQAVLSAFGPARVLALSGARATEAAIRAHAPTAALLHLAAHARANDADPASARITLTPADGDDGLLHAYEIDALRLRGSVVVLSACETGAGRLLGGEGVLSLSRAFLRAGARATVATLWPVGPSTAELMGTFYRELAAGAPPTDALRHAKLALARGTQGSPLYWAPFVLVARAP
jgi:CHAT domain-containing protein